ncbi:unnamed protein product [Adineta ricciae]|uniref:Uncharacterized protein n=1 Tax=Adineta ricciae TaxID=249248 RepID=A0A816EET0_ADIRI|nr:unnamed protein product [Adineta ricciae]
MQIIVWIGFTQFIRNVDSVWCINTKKQLSVSGKHLVSEFKKRLNNQDIYETTMCRIEMTYSRTKKDQSLHVTFGTSDPPVELQTNVHVRVNTSIIFKTKRKGDDVVNRIHLTCDSKDVCDRKFFFSHVDWLVNNNFTKLIDALRPLLQSKEKSSQCIVDNGINITISTCHSCAWNSFSSTNRRNQSNCYQGEYHRSELSMITDIILSDIYQHGEKNNITKTNQTRWYWCTNQSIVQEINDIIDKQSNWPPFYEALQTDSKTMTTKSTSITSLASSSAKNRIALVILKCIGIGQVYFM